MEFEKDPLPKSCSRGGVANTSSANWTVHPRIRRRMIYYFSAAYPILPFTEISNLIIYRVYQKKSVTDRENVTLFHLYRYNQIYLHPTWRSFPDYETRGICCTSSSTYFICLTCSIVFTLFGTVTEPIQKPSHLKYVEIITVFTKEVQIFLA
jgi:hypothetical protein